MQRMNIRRDYFQDRHLESKFTHAVVDGHFCSDITTSKATVEFRFVLLEYGFKSAVKN